MVKKIITMLILLLMMSSATFGAVSEDMSVYVRKDVFEVYMQNINTNMERILQRLDGIDKTMNDLSNRVSVLTGRIDGLEARMSDQQNYLYLGLVILGIIVGLPSVQRLLQSHVDRKLSITLEDVKRLIEEQLEKNNAELRKSIQV